MTKTLTQQALNQPLAIPFLGLILALLFSISAEAGSGTRLRAESVQADCISRTQCRENIRNYNRNPYHGMEGQISEGDAGSPALCMTTPLEPPMLVCEKTESLADIRGTSCMEETNCTGLVAGIPYSVIKLQGKSFCDMNVSLYPICSN